MEKEEMIGQLVKNLELLVDEMIQKYEDLQQENEELKKELSVANERSKEKDRTILEVHKYIASITPVKVYHHRKRRNTTVVFLDGNSVTVTRAKGDKNCLETAIVYALFKKNYPKKLLENLVNNVEQTGRKRKCKKN